MKKMLQMLAVLLMTVLFATVVCALDMPGDINSDREIDICDVMLTLRYIADWKVEINENAADINRDGIVSVFDCMCVLKYLSGHNIEFFENVELSELEDWVYTFDEDNGIIMLEDYVGTDPDVYVPASFTVNDVAYKTMVITNRSKQTSAFSGNQKIQSITFEDGVCANEMSYMFKACPNLRYVNKYPEYDGEWWLGVFVNCKKLVSAPPIPDNIENIRITSFFSKCENLLGTYSMPESYNANYSTNVFFNCNNMNKSQNILWLGDSITAGTSTETVSFVNYLREDLKDVGIANASVGGRTLSYGFDLVEKDIIASILHDLESFGTVSCIDYVFVSAGTNDFAHRSSRLPLGTYRFADVGEVSDRFPHTVSGAINIIISAVAKKFPNAKIIFTTPITRYNYDIEGAISTDKSLYTIHLKDFVDGIKAVCDAADVEYFDAYLESGLQVTEDSCDGSQYYCADKTHLTLAGQRKLADYFLEKMVSSCGFEKSE